MRARIQVRIFGKEADYGSGRKGKDLPHTYPEDSVHARTLHTKHLQQSFAKLLPLLPPNPLKPPWAGRFKGWWHHIFLGGKKGCCHHFWHFFYPKTTAGEGKYIRKRGRKRTEKGRAAEGPNTGYRRKGSRLQPARTLVSYGQTHSYSTVEPEFQPDGTKVPAWRNRLKLLVRMRVHTDEWGRLYLSAGATVSTGKTGGKYPTERKKRKKWWQHNFLTQKKRCCHHPQNALFIVVSVGRW